MDDNYWMFAGQIALLILMVATAAGVLYGFVLATERWGWKFVVPCLTVVALLLVFVVPLFVTVR